MGLLATNLEAGGHHDSGVRELLTKEYGWTQLLLSCPRRSTASTR